MDSSKIYTYWDHTFAWSPLHQTREQLRSKMHTYDRLGDECIDQINEIGRQVVNQDRQNDPDRKLPDLDVYIMLKDHAKDDSKLSEFWAQVNTVPDWVDWQQIKRGQEVFFRYGLPILNVFILQVSESVDAMKPGGVGNISSIRVRLLHAYLRSLICVRERYDNERYGVPINDLDSLATISSFSSIIIWLGLPRQGIWLRKQEIDDYLALWRLVAYYLGVPDEPFASQQTARALMESLLVSEVDPINNGRVLARNILHGLENKAPAHASMGFMEAMVRRLNGKQLSDSLRIPQPALYYRVLIYGYCFFVMALAYGTRLFPKLDQRFIAYRRRYYYTMITDREKGLGGESLFDFVYKPSHAGPLYKAVTVKEKEKIPKTSRRGIEALARVGLMAALIIVVTLLSGGYYVIRMHTRHYKIYYKFYPPSTKEQLSFIYNHFNSFHIMIATTTTTLSPSHISILTHLHSRSRGPRNVKQTYSTLLARARLSTSAGTRSAATASVSGSATAAHIEDC
ncbi:hypothetical protein BO83DRAFT_319745 [Aspergillus eucalypticola CBS 122712]|uniref:ER-bound oxygenase mpaB/mpaB'/Rubber oxygenase catalytic domain-containing protein n=1 Tax=Aspergillus eucalypticola (strain CBS 122712 / IBT 29274) TaxID=1448314 RepID=A0A317V3B7_ASPEC|nr:uncharacterized protein BO83DRAFT_319745 [Aspergillus eucalypticola CBS 122712]PWY66680.1 hypothetical protein BO83DRAFT_319745 [Aspergillus eucalypticola CBS 122712]